MFEIKNIDVFYDDIQALWGTSLKIEQGEIVALIGANGAGKTTAINAISGIVRISAGEIYFNGERLDKKETHEIVELGVVQVPEGRKLFPMMTVTENLEMGSYIPKARKHRQENLEWVMSLFPRLKERRNQLAGSMSGGEQQMVAIARGLMSRPKLLMLDEPSLGLAPIVVREIFENVKKISKEGMTVLIVEQNTSQTLAMSDRGFVMENGRIVLEGTGKELLANEHVKKAYLGL